MEEKKSKRDQSHKWSHQLCASCGAELPRPQDDRLTYYLLRVGEIKNAGLDNRNEVSGATLCCGCGDWVLNLIDTWSTAGKGGRKRTVAQPLNVLLVPTTAPGLRDNTVLVNADRAGRPIETHPISRKPAPVAAPADATPAEWPVQLDGAQPFKAS